MTIIQLLEENLTDFIWNNCLYLHKEDTKEHLAKEIDNDLKHGNIVFTSDEQGLTGVCRFSILGDMTRILDVAIREDKRGSWVLQDLLRLGLKYYPDVKKLSFNSIKSKREFTIPANLFLAKGN